MPAPIQDFIANRTGAEMALIAIFAGIIILNAGIALGRAVALF